MNSKPTMMFLLLLCVVQVFGQSNYASHANNINYIGSGLPEETVLDGKVSDIDSRNPLTAWVINGSSLWSSHFLRPKSLFHVPTVE